MQPGDVLETLTLTTDDPAAHDLKIPLRGRGTTARVRISEPNLDFQEVGVHKTVNLPVVLYNDGDGDLVISRISSESQQFWSTEDSLAVPAGQSRILTIAFRPFWTVTVSRRITLTTNDPDHPRVILRVSGRGVPRRPVVRFEAIPSSPEEVRVAVHIEDAPPITGYAVSVRFDPELLRFENAAIAEDEETPFLGDLALNPPHLLKNDVVTFGSARPTSTGPVPGGSGLLGLLTFRPTDGFTPDRTTALRVEGVSLRNPSGNSEIGESVLTIQRGKFGILRGDINEDGSIDLADFFLLGQGFGLHEVDPDFDGRLDLNGDGIIGLEDLFIFQDGMKKK